MVKNKKKELNWIKANTMSHDSFSDEIKRLEILENGTAIIAGTGHIINDDMETTYESSNVLVRRMLFGKPNCLVFQE